MNIFPPTLFPQRFVFRQAVVFLVLVSSVFTGCKDDNVLGLEVQPEGSLDRLQFLDTFTIEARTIKGEAQRSSQFRTLVGVLNNDVFGRSESAMFLNFRLESENFSLEHPASEYTIDSVVLTIIPRELYGNGADALPIEAFLLEEQIYIDSIYQSNRDFRVDEIPLGEAQIQFNSNEAIQQALTDSAQNYNGLHFKLDNDLGSFILNGMGTEFYNTQQLQSYFKGIKLQTKTGVTFDKGVIYDFAIEGLNTGLFVYYHHKETPEEQLEFKLEMGSTTSRIAQFSHDVVGSMVQSALDSPQNHDYLFVQGMSGVKSLIEIPYLDEFGAK
ncbi:MAG: DUF4270 family protein, partial [Salibacteraceae bacterium]